MVKIKEAEDCGNSPKNRLVQDVAVAFETGDLSDDIFDDALEWRRNDAAPVVGGSLPPPVVATPSRWRHAGGGARSMGVPPVEVVRRAPRSAASAARASAARSSADSSCRRWATRRRCGKTI